MHDYTRRILLRSNLTSLKGHVFTDFDTIFINLCDNSIKKSFLVKDTGYELFINVSKLSEYSTSFVLNVEMYDINGDNIPIKLALQFFESETEFRNFIKQCVVSYIDALNALQLKVKYIVTFNTYDMDVRNNKLYTAVYDFTTNKFLDIPDLETIILQFEEPDTDKLIEYIMKSNDYCKKY